MTAFRRVCAEIAGMFVDDARLALFQALLIAVLAIWVKLGSLPPVWGSILLLLGCLAILAESVFRARP